MSYEKARAVTLNAASGSDLAAGRFVDMGGSGLVYASAASGGVGVTAEAYDDSEVAAGNGSPAIPVVVEGVVAVAAGAALPLGTRVTGGTDGVAIAASAPALAQGVVVGAAGAAGEFASVLLQPAAISQA